jgi:hypothetical protein
MTEDRNNSAAVKSAASARAKRKVRSNLDRRKIAEEAAHPAEAMRASDRIVRQRTTKFRFPESGRSLPQRDSCNSAPLVLLCYKRNNRFGGASYCRESMGVVPVRIQTVEDIYRLVWNAVLRRCPIHGHVPRTAPAALPVSARKEWGQRVTCAVLSVRG